MVEEGKAKKTGLSVMGATAGEWTRAESETSGEQWERRMNVGAPLT